jgi:hypothetical protein
MNKFDSDETVLDEGGADIISEYKRIKYRRAMPDKKMLVFAAGGVLGMVFFYMFNGGDIIIADDFWNSGFSMNEYTGMFQYVFSIRLKQLLFLLICSFSYIGNLMAYGTLGSLGFEFILILFTFVYNYKLKGILLSIVMLLPQGIFYLLLFSIIFEGCYNNEKPSVYKQKALFLWKIIMGVILFALGFLCETCINFEVLQRVLQIQ